MRAATVQEATRAPWPSTLGDDGTSAEISTALSAAGLTPDAIQSAVTSYTGLDANAQSSILNILQGGKVTATSLAPLIAAGLAATGVGAPVVAAVAAALPIIDAIAGLLQPKPPQCDWYIGAACVTGKRPYGPGDPLWVSFAQFVAGTDLLAPGAPGQSPGARAADATVDAAYPWYRQTIACELAAMQAAGFFTLAGQAPLDPSVQFFQTYYLAWQKNKEYEINGFTSASDYALLIAVANAWNEIHAGSPTLTIAAASPAPTSSAYCVGGGVRYPNLLLAGDVDGNRHAPVTLNLGATSSAPPAKSASPSSSASASSSSSGAAIAVGVGVVAVGGGVLLWRLGIFRALGGLAR